MSIKKQIINYLEHNKTVAGNFIFFDELPTMTEKKTKIKSEIITTNQPISEPKQTTVKAQKINIEVPTVTPINIIPTVDKKLTVEKTFTNQTVQNSNKIKLPDLTNYQTLEELKNGISSCQNCVLGATRNNFVFGEGNPNADIMVIGEAPGAEEDEQGMPFVGRAGKLLTDILRAIKFERKDVYIANICKCRPPANRKPTLEEIYYCEPYLKKQIDLIKPKFILALGLTAAEMLFPNQKPPLKMAESRGKLFDYHGIKTLITYHPAALLRNPNWKRPVWEDVQFLRNLYDEYLEKM